ncbi:hypothetical protein BC628DRAFT_1499320 [Trametes gibbosa]|nr:hypothetical protein BC628DRAFT_1499320 [Trametes gibbosa]
MSFAFVRLAAALLAAALLLPLACVQAAEIDANRMALERRYTTPHSLGDNYVFDPRDGWQTVNTTNLSYKYSSLADSHSDLDDDDDDDDDDDNYADGSALVPRAKKLKVNPKAHKKSLKKAVKNTSKKAAAKATSKLTGSAGVLSGGLSKVIDTIKAIGKPEPVIITWYTGHDLLNPSCWQNTDWHPSDSSFAAALTLEGWDSKPQCFKFMELCHTPQKCIFVRVVDSCAGCAKGSKHVDLTKAAFNSIAPLDQGLLTVQMRQATDPKNGWSRELWGPQV